MTNSTDKPSQPLPQSSTLPPNQGQAQQQHRGSFAPAPRGAHTTSEPQQQPPPPQPEQQEEVPPSTWWPEGVPGEVGSAPDTSGRGHGPEGDQHPQPDQSGTNQPEAAEARQRRIDAAAAAGRAIEEAAADRVAKGAQSRPAVDKRDK